MGNIWGKITAWFEKKSLPTLKKPWLLAIGAIFIVAVIAVFTAISFIPPKQTQAVTEQSAPMILVVAEGSSLCEVILNTKWLPVDIENWDNSKSVSERRQNEESLAKITSTYIEEFSEGKIGESVDSLSDGFSKLNSVTTSTDVLSAATQVDFALRTLNTACEKAGFERVELTSIVSSINASVEMAIPSSTPQPNGGNGQGTDPNRFQPLSGSVVLATRGIVSKCGKSKSVCLDVEVTSKVPCPGGMFVDVVFKGIHSNAPVDSNSVTTRPSSKKEEFKLHFESSSPKAGSAEVVDLVCIGGE